MKPLHFDFVARNPELLRRRASTPDLEQVSQRGIVPPPSTEREREREDEGECGVEWRAQKKEMEKRGERCERGERERRRSEP